MKFTQAQILFFHALESLGFGLVASVAAGIYQYVVTNGLHWQGLLATGGLIFIGHLSTAYKSLMASPALPQAINDTVGEIKQEVVGHTSLLNTLVGFLTSPPQANQQLPFPASPANANFGVMPVSPSQFQQAPTNSYPLAALGRNPSEAMPQPPKG